MSGSCQLSPRQIIILRLIAKEARAGMIFIPWHTHYMDGEFLIISGAGDANCIMSLIRRGLIREVVDMLPYTCEITDEGWEWIKVLEKVQE